jgi:hypothetical protein
MWWFGWRNYSQRLALPTFQLLLGAGSLGIGAQSDAAAKTQARQSVCPPNSAGIVAQAWHVLVWIAVAHAPDSRLHLRALTARSSPCCCVRGRRRTLPAGGRRAALTSLAEQLGRALPPFQRELDGLVIPACGRDDVQGLFGLNESVRYRGGLLGL